MKILLCGSSGRVGGEIERIGSLLGVNIVAYGSSLLNITNPDSIARIIGEVKPDMVINVAAYMDIDGAEVEQQLAYRINRDGPQFLAACCNNFNIPIIHISTDYVFSGDKKGGYSEDDIPNPINIYGKSKLEGERAIALTCDKFVIIRSSWLFGERGNNFVKTIIRKAVDGGPIGVVTNETGCPTSVFGLASCIIEVAMQIYRGNLAWGLYHFCGAPEINRYEYAIDIINMVRRHKMLKYCHIEPLAMNRLDNKAERPRNSSMKTDKIFNVFNIKPDDWHSALVKLVPLLLTGV